MLRALRTEALLRPVHVSEQMVGLHGGDYLQLFEAGNLHGRSDLSVLDP